MTSCLVVEILGLHVPLLEFSRNHPGCVLDLAADSVPGTDQLRALLRASHVPPQALPKLIEEAESAFQQVRTIERPPGERVWLAALTIPRSSLGDPRMAKLGEFLDRHGLRPSWVRVEEGVCFVRALVPPDEDPSALVNRCRGYLESLDVDAEVAVEPVAEAQLKPWIDLVEEAGFSRRQARGTDP